MYTTLEGQWHTNAHGINIALHRFDEQKVQLILPAAFSFLSTFFYLLFFVGLCCVESEKPRPKRASKPRHQYLHSCSEPLRIKSKLKPVHQKLQSLEYYPFTLKFRRAGC